MKVRFELNEGIVTGATKRLLEQYNTGLVFTQRGCYDEYYSKTVGEVDTTIEVLSLISERLSVEISGDVVSITGHRYIT